MKNKLMIVDDEVLIRRGLKKTLQKHFPYLEYLSAADGQEAMAVYEEEKPDIIITDIRMPKMSGLEFVRHLAEAGANASCVIISGYEEFDYARQAIRYGVENYLLKPIDEVELVRTVTDIFEKNCILMLEQQMREGADRIIVPEGMAVLNQYPRCWAGFYHAERNNGNLLEMARKILSKEEISGVYLENFRLLLFSTSMEEQILKQYVCSVSEKVRLDMSSSRESWEDLRTMIHEINFVEGQSIYWNQNYALFHEEVRRETDVACVAWSEFRDRIIRRIILADRDGMDKELDELFLCIQKAKPLAASLFYQLDLLLAEVFRHETVRCFMAGREEPYLSGPLEIYTSLEALSNGFRKPLKKLMEHIENAKEQESRKVIEAAKTFIKKHIYEDISLKMVADYIAMNPVYFSALFKKESGKNFTEFVTEEKMKKAEHMLVNMPEKRISDIAWQLGYEDAKYFNRIFKKRNQMTPSVYREKYI